MNESFQRGRPRVHFLLRFAAPINKNQSVTHLHIYITTSQLFLFIFINQTIWKTYEEVVVGEVMLVNSVGGIVSS